MKPKLPSPYDYLDYRRYLTDWFAKKKEANPAFSHRLFARLAKQKSPSLLNNVIERRRNLTPANTALFIKALGLRPGEGQFFELLVALDQAKNESDRQKAWEQVSATRRFRQARRTDLSAFDYVSNWSVPVIRELATRSDFRPDPEWVADTLRPRITVAEAKRGLRILQDLGLLVELDGDLVPAEASVATPPEITGLAYRNYHRGMLERAHEAIERFEGDERHLLAVTVGVPKSLLPKLKAESNAFLERMMHLCDSSEEDADEILQMNLQIFPVTSRREESE